MGRKRINDKDLPQRWTRKHGSIYYQVPPGKEHEWDGKKWFRLGKTEPEAYRAWAERLDSRVNITTFSQLCDRFLLEYTSTLRPATQDKHRSTIRRFRKVFGDYLITEFKSEWAFQYHNTQSKNSVSSANSDIKTLGSMFSKSIEWGLLPNSAHPTRGLAIKTTEKPRDRYVEDWELEEAISVATDFMRLYITFKLLTGMDKSTILTVKRSDLMDEGIVSSRIKTKGKKRLYEWTPELKECTEKILTLFKHVDTDWLFLNTKGEPYINEDGRTWSFNSIWRKFMKRALEKTKLEVRFTEHDLRAKAASDSESLEFAQFLLGHTTSGMTKRVYRRKMEVVSPATIKAKI